MKKAVIYVRTSSMKNVGDEKDSDDRQIAKCVAYAEANDIELMEEKNNLVTFYDEGVSGTTEIMDRKAFYDLVQYCLDHSVDYILVEDISRFSRDAIKSELGRSYLIEQGIDIVPVNAPDLFLNDDKTDPTRRFIRLVIAGIADLERNQIALRLASGRRKKRKLKHEVTAQGKGKCGGNRGYHETHPDLVKLVHQIKEKHPSASLRFISQIAFKQGLKNKKGNPFNPNQIKRILSITQEALCHIRTSPNT
tara:strand:- start:1513 stop:2262 length:750 start_codon:yes stop_codon:yes gene_type:complete